MVEIIFCAKGRKQSERVAFLPVLRYNDFSGFLTAERGLNMNSLSNDKQNILFDDICQLIDKTKSKVAVTFNSEITLMFWNIGKRINSDI